MKAIGNVASGRDESYEYTYSDDEKIEISFKSKSELELFVTALKNQDRNAVIKNFVYATRYTVVGADKLQMYDTIVNMLPNMKGTYVIKTDLDKNTSSTGYRFMMYQSPAFLMQLLAAASAKSISEWDFLNYDVAKYLESAKSEVIYTSVRGVAHPHYKETYYLLSTKASSSDYK